MSLAGILNTAWMLKCATEARAFRLATRQVADTQSTLLGEILKRNRDTHFGRAHGFRDIGDVRRYQECVPISRHDDLVESIDRIAAGERGVLTAEPVRLLEPTSGTTGGEKLIPYTDSLRRQFQRAVAVWIADLFHNRPTVRQGRAYWSISPHLGPPRRTSGGITIGFDEDVAYLGTLEQAALQRLLVVPSCVARLTDMETFRYCTLHSLLCAEDLTLVSIWNPTFLPALLAPLEGWTERLCRDLHDGTLRPPAPLPPDIARRLAPARPDRSRRALLARVLQTPLRPAEKMTRIWPRLALLSCWTDAGAASGLQELRELFPGVEIQSKGLLATEGCVTVPLVGIAAPVLAIRSHFFEFLEGDGVGEHGTCRLAHELEANARYRVVLTTGGGLYRYSLRDVVQVAGFLDKCPLLRFLGKADRVSDLVGEKLADAHVGVVMARAFSALGLTPRFALLAPVAGRRAHYRLYVQCEPLRAGMSSDLQAAVEIGLRENPHYDHAVGMGQLNPVKVVRLRDGVSAWRVYEQRYLARGQEAGSIKPAALDAWTGWADEFRPFQLDELPEVDSTAY
jgi:GH3 auxin-responsive promoter